MSDQLTNAELECLRSLQRAADELGVPIVAVGANARRLVFNLPDDIPIHRTTTDWDFGVRVPNWVIFEHLRTKLLEQSDSFKPGRQEHELIHQATSIRVDLVPFGGLENDGRIRWPVSTFEMTVFGFSDAYENATHYDLAPGLRMAVATVPLLVALKLFAFADRKNETDRDLTDLRHVIQNYQITGRESALFEQPFSTVIDENFEWEYAGSLLLGYEINRACKPATLERLLPILEKLADPYSDDIGKLISRSSSQEQEEVERRRVSSSFSWLMKGLQLPR